MFTDRNEIMRMKKEDVAKYLKTLSVDSLRELQDYLNEKMGEDTNSTRRFTNTRAWIAYREFGPARKTGTIHFSDMLDDIFKEAGL